MDPTTIAHPDASAVARLLSSIRTHGINFHTNAPGSREALLESLKSLTSLLETPNESILKYMWIESSHHAVIRTAIEMKLFERMAEDSATTKTDEELAVRCKGNSLLVARILRHLAAMGTVIETSARNYRLNPLSTALTMPNYRDTFTFCFDVIRPGLQVLPTYLKERYYQEGEGFKVFNKAFNYPGSLFAYLVEHPKLMSTFNNYMAGRNQGLVSWMDTGFYPVEEGLAAGFDMRHSPTLLVDVGGGNGHDLEEFREKHPKVQGSLVLQDLPEVINDITALDASIQRMPHDFTTLQPVKGARAYFLHSVLHDWSDEKAREILKNLIPAMVKEYSKILIQEVVIPDKEANAMTTGLDWALSCAVPGRERTELQWRELLELEGLAIVKIWSHPQSIESLIEVELVN
ncbi:hypothetical protein OIDMADRAFT_36616 [Oidiodendron maius Zn]|uniref:Uncharacterized protein n=1 Tax=Oidiodendron maius (strain Zn) TaxID=913774 RepID=A0A0C3HF33_OIDMZ|nr:hypothetical protein OIDMADRAFT_36616 [Oidiodendron maius Zn]